MTHPPVNQGRATGIFSAILSGNDHRVAVILKDSPASILDRTTHYAWLPALPLAYARGETPLHLAAACAHVAIVKRLLRAGADPNAINVHGHRPLRASVQCGPEMEPARHLRQARIVAFLVRAGADPNAGDIRGVTPLHSAVRCRCSRSVAALLDHGARIRARNNATGATPLHLAVQNTGRGGTGRPAARSAQSAIIKLLLSRGARASDRDRRGRTVTDWATGFWTAGLLGTK